MTHLLEVGSWLLQIIGGYLLADFISGLVHWAMDCYGSRETPLIGGEIGGNRRHHIEPRHFIKNSWWQNARSTFPIILVLFAIFWGLDLVNPTTVTLLLVGWNSNEIHKWAHMPQSQRPRWVSFLQQKGIVISPKQHQAHHSHNKDSSYCAVSPYLNPILNSIRFWRGMEWVVYRLTGTQTVLDETTQTPQRRPIL